MGNAYVEFVKDYQKKNNIKSYKEAISKASAEWRKKKAEISKDKEKKTDKVKEVKEKQKAQKKVKASKTATAQEKDQDLLNRIKKRSGAIVIKANKDLAENKITEAEHDKQIREAVEKAKEKEEKLTDLSSVLSSLKGGAIEQMEVKPISKTDRTKKLRKYKKLKEEVFKALDEGKRSDSITEFKKLATELKGKSEKNAYARDLKKLERTLGSKKFGKREEKLKKKSDNLKMVITEQKEPKGVRAKAGVSETAFGKEQDLLNRVRKKVGAELKAAAKRFNDGKISETEYTRIIDNIKNEVEERERARDAAIKALPAGRRAEARLLADVRDAVGGDQLPSVAQARDTVVPPRRGQTIRARVLPETAVQLIDRVLGAGDVRELIDALLPASRRGGRITTAVFDNVFRRLRGLETRFPNDDRVAELRRVMENRRAELNQAITDRTRGASAPQAQAPRAPRAPAIPAPPIREGEPTPERVRTEIEGAIDTYLRQRPAQIGQRLGNVMGVLNNFVINGDFRIGRNNVAVPPSIRESQMIRQRLVDLVNADLVAVYREYTPPVGDDEFFRIRRMNDAFKDLDTAINGGTADLAYREDKLITGETAKALKVPEDFLEPIDVSGNRNVEVMSPDGRDINIILQATPPASPAPVAPSPVRQPPPDPRTARQRDLVSQQRRTEVEDFMGNVALGSSRARLGQEKTRDQSVERLPTPEEFAIVQRAGTLEEAQQVAQRLNLPVFFYRRNTYNTQNLDQLQNRAEVVETVELQNPDLSTEQRRQLIDTFLAVEEGRRGDDDDADDAGGGTAGQGFASMAPQPELFSKEEMDEMGGGLITKAMLAYSVIKKIHNKILKFAKHKKVKGVEKADQLELDLTKQSYEKPDKRRKNVKGFVYQPELSSDELAVYQNPATKRVVMAHRGSSNLDDLKTDLRLAVGGIRKTKRYDRDIGRLEAVQSAFPNDRIDFTGHSLGGTVAIEMNSLLPKDKSSAVVFNAGHTPFRKLGVKDRDITYYTHKGDIVSMLGANSYKNVKYIDKDKSNPVSAHVLSAFKDEDGKDFKEPEQNEASSLVQTEGGGFGKKDVRKMKKHIEGIMREADENEKIRKIEKMMKDTDKLPNSFMKKEMLKLAHQLLNN